MLQEEIINNYMNILERIKRGYKEDLGLLMNQIMFYEYRNKLNNPEVYERKLFGGNLALQ